MSKLVVLSDSFGATLRWVPQFGHERLRRTWAWRQSDSTDRHLYACAYKAFAWRRLRALSAHRAPGCGVLARSPRAPAAAGSPPLPLRCPGMRAVVGATIWLREIMIVVSCHRP